MKINDVILRTISKGAILIIFTLGIYLLLSGHNHPGGGFVGGLVIATAFILLFLTHDADLVRKAIPFDFKKVSALGILLMISNGVIPLFFGRPFLSQSFRYFDLPIFGKTELSTTTLFEIGIALSVIGVVVTIIQSIGEKNGHQEL